jgi:hypothetical protein
MGKEEIIKQAERIKSTALGNAKGALIEAMEFFRTYCFTISTRIFFFSLR